MCVENIKEFFQAMRDFDSIPFYIMFNTAHDVS